MSHQSQPELSALTNNVRDETKKDWVAPQISESPINELTLSGVALTDQDATGYS